MKEPNVYSFYDECYVYYGDYVKEIERLNKENEYLNKVNIELSTLNTSLRSDRDNYKSIIKEVRECINHYAIENEDYSKIYNDEEKELLEILDKADKDV